MALGCAVATAGPCLPPVFTGEGGLQSLLGNMSHSQLMQLIGPAGLGGLGKTLLAVPGSPIRHLSWKLFVCWMGGGTWSWDLCTRRHSSGQEVAY